METISGMRADQVTRRSLGLRVLERDQIEDIHQATLEVLDRTGVEVYNDHALDVLRRNGARVQGRRVRLPAWMVEEALRSRPQRVPIGDRAEGRAMLLEADRFYFGTGSDTPFVLDPFTQQRRPATKRDVEQATLVSDSLPNIDFVMSLGLASDVPARTSDLHQFEAMLLNTTKPIIFTAHDAEGLLDILEMAAIAKGGEEDLEENPNVILYAEPSSPLMHSNDALEKVIIASERRIPVIYTPAVIVGATGPVTVAGAIVQGNAEQLSGLVIQQLVAKGAPFIYGGGIPIMDMVTSVCTYAAPELHLANVLLAEMSRFYGLPVFTTAGCSDSMLFDQQAGIEAGFTIMLNALSGANLIHDVGYLGSGTTSSLEMLVACDEVIGLAKRIVAGLDTSREALAVDLIHKVGPGGHYLAEEHTLRNLRKELWFPSPLINRQNYDGWVASGSKTMGERVRERIKEILANHRPPALEPSKREAIAEVIKRREV